MKVGFVSLGCPKNLVDGEVMLGFARDAGHEITPHAPAADAILEMAQHKRDGKCSRLVVTGCLAERYREELRKEIPEIDALIGTGELPDIVEALRPIADNRYPITANRDPITDVRPLTFHKKHVGHR